MDERRKRLTHDDPQGMVEALHNTAYVKDREVWLRAVHNGKDQKLTEFCGERCHQRCGVDIANVPAVDFAEYMDCDCAVSWLYFIAVGAAEIREKLKKYEDCFQDPAHVEKIKDLVATEERGGDGGN